MSSIVKHILKPGSALSMVPAINGAVCLLLGVLMYVGYNLELPMIHVAMLSFFSFGLLISVNWFYHEYQLVVTQQKAVNEDKSE